jgi:sugar transferase (PEP-CTERM/EpsH1 system associated)
LNILFLSHRVPFPPNKGEKIRTFNQLKYLTDNNHEITVCSPLEHHSDVDLLKSLKDKYSTNIAHAALVNKPFRLIKGLAKREPLSIANFYSNSLQVKFDDMLGKNKYDVVICTSSAMAEYIYRSNTLNRLSKKPKLLMDFMDLDSDKWQQYANNSAWPLKWVYEREATLLSSYEEKITHDFNTSFFIADAEVNLFKAKTKSSGKVLTMGNGMDTNEYSPAPEEPSNEDPVFLFTGVMDYKPNIDAVIWFVEQIWSNIIKQYPKSRFIIAGMNPSSSVQELVSITGIEITGFVDDILPYYHQSDYFVAPFRLARGVQNKILQAFSCGLPVISTPMGAEGIDCTQNENILIASTQTEFLGAIEKLENDEVFRTEIKESALALIKDHYSWQSKLQVLDDVLHDRV